MRYLAFIHERLEETPEHPVGKWEEIRLVNAQSLAEANNLIDAYVKQHLSDNHKFYIVPLQEADEFNSYFISASFIPYYQDRKIMKNKIVPNLPDDTDEIEYYYMNNNKDLGIIQTEITYDCSCRYQITWNDITKGQLKEITLIEVCLEHDPTIPFCEPEGEVE